MGKQYLDSDGVYCIAERIKAELEGIWESNTSTIETAEGRFNELRKQCDELSTSLAQLEQAFKQFAEFIEERLDALESTREQIDESELTREQLECGQDLCSALDLDFIFKRKE